MKSFVSGEETVTERIVVACFPATVSLGMAKLQEN